jgi:hypothetical protein
MGDWRTNARARHSNCLWPTEKFSPFSVTLKFKPPTFWLTKSFKCARSIARIKVWSSYSSNGSRLYLRRHQATTLPNQPRQHTFHHMVCICREYGRMVSLPSEQIGNFDIRCRCKGTPQWQASTQPCTPAAMQARTHLMLPVNSTGSCGMIDNLDRNACNPSVEMSMPSILIVPPHGSTIRNSVKKVELFPAP